MAKSPSVILFLASALCVLSLAVAHGNPIPRFYVEGKVYCDTCRAQFVTRISDYMAGAKVRLECRDREGGTVKYSVDGQTDKLGTYVLTIDGEHEEEVCDITLVESSDHECSEINQDAFLRKSARISLTTNNGITSPVRLANPLGFMRKTPLPECTEVLRELGITPEGLF
ncbi:hypothetical protein SLE2022_389050 [Rubroshorea leprosula]